MPQRSNCCGCLKSFRSAEVREQHINESYGKESQCNHCCETFRSPCLMVRHWGICEVLKASIIKDDSGGLRCNDCFKECFSIANLSLHISCKPFKCDDCLKYVSKFCSLEIHRSKVASVYSCKICGGIIDSECLKIQHSTCERFHKMLKYNLENCGRQQKISSKVNVENCTEETKCDFCNKIFASKCQCTYHMETSCGIIRVYNKNHGLDAPSFQCDQCSEWFPSATNFGRHIYDNHFKAESVSLDKQNNPQLTSKGHLEEANLSNSSHDSSDISKIIFGRLEFCNTKNGKFQCNFCYKTFESLDYLLIHFNFCELPREYVLEYEGDKCNLTCKDCLQNFSTFPEFALHVLSKSFQCDECSTYFSTIHKLDLHKVKPESQDKMECCKICGAHICTKCDVLKHKKCEKFHASAEVTDTACASSEDSDKNAFLMDQCDGSDIISAVGSSSGIHSQNIAKSLSVSTTTSFKDSSDSNNEKSPALSGKSYQNKPNFSTFVSQNFEDQIEKGTITNEANADVSTLKCNHCNLTFLSSCKLERHIINNTCGIEQRFKVVNENDDKTMFHCRQCLKQFSHIKDINHHLLGCKNPVCSVIKCTKCCRVFRRQKAFDLHKKCRSVHQFYYCQSCYRLIDSECVEQIHLIDKKCKHNSLPGNTTNVEKITNVSSKNPKSNNLRGNTTHLADKITKVSSKNSKSNKLPGNTTNLVDKITKVSSKNPSKVDSLRVLSFQCNHCHLIFADRDLFELHMVNICRIIDDFYVVKSDKNMLFECRMCNKCFPNLHQFNLHLLEYDHSKVTAIRCSECLISFKYSGDYELHKTLLKEPYKCRICRTLVESTCSSVIHDEHNTRTHKVIRSVHATGPTLNLRQLLTNYPIDNITRRIGSRKCPNDSRTTDIGSRNCPNDNITTDICSRHCPNASTITANVQGTASNMAKATTNIAGPAIHGAVSAMNLAQGTANIPLSILNQGITYNAHQSSVNLVKRKVNVPGTSSIFLCGTSNISSPTLNHFPETVLSTGLSKLVVATNPAQNILFGTTKTKRSERKMAPKIPCSAQNLVLGSANVTSCAQNISQSTKVALKRYIDNKGTDPCLPKYAKLPCSKRYNEPTLQTSTDVLPDTYINGHISENTKYTSASAISTTDIHVISTTSSQIKRNTPAALAPKPSHSSIISSSNTQDLKKPTSEIHNLYFDHSVLNSMHLIMDTKNLDCNVCLFRFDSVSRLVNHAALEHLSTQGQSSGHNKHHTCVMCEQTFPDERSILDHVVNVHFKSTEKGSLNDVNNMARNTKVNVTGDADASKNNEMMLSTHDKPLPQRLIHCTICDRIFEDQLIWIEHRRDNMHRLQCRFCSFTAGNTCRLMNHLQHLCTHVGVLIKDSGREFIVCKLCWRKFHDKRSLVIHVINSHTLNTNYNLSNTENIAVSESNLLKKNCESPNHSSDSESVSKTTGLVEGNVGVVSTRGQFSVHAVDGSAVRLFVCIVCRKTFISMDSIVSHINQKHKLRCQDCSKYFSPSDNIIHKALFVDGDKIYNCRFCGEIVNSLCRVNMHQNCENKLDTAIETSNAAGDTASVGTEVTKSQMTRNMIIIAPEETFNVTTCDRNVTTRDWDVTSHDINDTNHDLEVTTCDGNITTRNMDVTTSEGNITTHHWDVTTCDGNITTHHWDVTTCNGNITTHHWDVTTCDGNITTRDLDVNTCDGNITAQDLDVTTCDGNITTRHWEIVSPDGNVTSSDNIVTSCDSNVTSSDNNVTSYDSNVTSSDNNITSCDSNGTSSGLDHIDEQHIKIEIKDDSDVTVRTNNDIYIDKYIVEKDNDIREDIKIEQGDDMNENIKISNDIDKNIKIEDVNADIISTSIKTDPEKVENTKADSIAENVEDIITKLELKLSDDDVISIVRCDTEDPGSYGTI